MRKYAFVFLICAVAVFSILVHVHAQEKTFSGSIMDSQCVSMGGHETMYNDQIKNPKDCTLECVKEGGTFVLYDASAQMGYQLDDQKKPEPFAGQKVTVTGTYDDSTMTIHVTKIEAAK
jgi:hypothetical protein